MSKRILYFDVLRGLAIVGVVAIHSSGKGLSFPLDSFNFNFTIFWRQLLNFSVPLFIALSGYFMARKNIVDLREYISFIKKQVPRVYIPCAFWSFISVSMSFILFDKPSLKDIAKALTFQTFGPYYFIALIIQFYFLLPLLKKRLNKVSVLVSILISLSMTILIFYIRYYTNYNMPVIIYAGIFPTWIIFFMSGLYFGSGRKIQISNILLVFGIVSFYVFSCIETYFVYSKFGQIGDAVTAVKPTSFIYSLFVIFFLLKNINFVKMTILRLLGEMSFGIYLIHMFILPIIGKFFYRFSVSLVSVQPLYQLSLIIVTLISCYLFVFVSKKTFHNKVQWLIGFRS